MARVKTRNIFQTYLNRLTNLTANNRSILLLRLPKEQFIDVHKFNLLDHKPSFHVIAALLAGKAAKVCQVLDSRVEANNEVSERLKRLQRLDRFIFEERGSNDLHIGWPFVRGKLMDGTLIRAPLLFFPVNLKQSRNDWIVEPRRDAGIVLNKSFALAYAYFNKVDLPDDLLETNFEDFDKDSTVWRTQLYQLLQDKVQLNFNPDNFRDELTPFAEFKKADFDASNHVGALTLFPEAVLGIFPQAGSQLVADYKYLIDVENFSDIDAFFLRNVSEQEEVPAQEEEVIREERLYIPFETDAWQENAIKKTKAGKSIVVQGPPGTGKSQLICNLVADAVASGKKVLVVCQKRAALDVVYRRLQEIDMDDFLGLVHDFRNDRREIFTKIARQIDRIDDYRARNRSVDIIHMERRFVQLCRRIDAVVEELEEFRRVLYDDSECGLPVKQLYLTSDPAGDAVNLKQEYQYFKFHDLDDFLRKMKSYAGYAEKFVRDRYVWNNRKSFAGMQRSDMNEIIGAVREIPVFQATIAKKIVSVLPSALSLEDCESLLGREDDILGMLSVLKDDETYTYFLHMLRVPDEETSLLWLANTERVLMSCYEGPGPEIHTPPEELGKLQQVLRQCMLARRSLFRFLRWHFSGDKTYLRNVLSANHLEYSKEGFKELEKKLDSRLNIEHHFTALKQKPWLMDFPKDYRKFHMRRWFEREKLAVRAKIIFNTIREVNELIDPTTLTRYDFNRIFHQLLSICSEIPGKKINWVKNLTPFQIRQLIHDPSLADEFVDTLKRDFDSLCEFDKLKEGLTETEVEVIHKLHNDLGWWTYDKLEALLRNSLSLHWIDYIENKYPILRIVSSTRMEELQAELWQLVREKQRLSRDIILLRTREQVYDEIEYNRLNNRVTYRDLHHQVTKQKKLWPLRKVVTEMQGELLRLVPCWLASPEAVSAIFPMKEIFDLVIFDEASQCFAERGIPAMYRGKQVVIAGDVKQLRPFELYQVRWEEEDPDEPDTEVDSLLELAERYLEGVSLQGHYRSRSPELIDFSNRHFYDGNLRQLPDRHLLNRNEPAIRYVKVDGVWESNRNLVEAETVVEQVFHLLTERPELDVGVVTFNAEQQYLILDLLEAEAVQRNVELPDSLFVKNIENVQGDEKDVIIFSVGYAPDKRGKMVMQFGSLNLAGGENRLNVAVTRARQHTIIVSSIWPEQLKTEKSRNKGPKLLKEYLTFCKSVQEGEFVPRTNPGERHPDSWYLKTHLERFGRERFPQSEFLPDVLPYTDLCVKQNGAWLGAILTDDERYFESLSVKDTHAYTPEQLTRMRWEFRSVYSRNFWLGAGNVENDMLRILGLHDNGTS